jgi:hypothetical protein
MPAVSGAFVNEGLPNGVLVVVNEALPPDMLERPSMTPKMICRVLGVASLLSLACSGGGGHPKPGPGGSGGDTTGEGGAGGSGPGGSGGGGPS